MIDLKPVRAAVVECFATDPTLIARYHVDSGQGLEACIERTMDDVAGFDPSFRFFTVREGGRLVAYWGTEWGRYINLIFVKPSHRNRNFMRSFWKHVQDSVETVFYAGVYEKNQPAIQFYQKLGQVVGKTTHRGNSIVAFKFKKEIKCQQAEQS